MGDRARGQQFGDEVLVAAPDGVPSLQGEQRDDAHAGHPAEIAIREPDPAARTAPRARVVAFYLPQFHPVPENDEWWGAGFTEWTNVAKARPLYPGHRQPQQPGDLGFYDLRVPETREAQADLAREHGVEAFCYWHYWFGGGRRLLERPFTEVLGSGRPEFGFCLAWANQTWTGIWHGAADRILVQQSYPGPEDDAAHFAAILPAFRDPRYLRVDGRPLFYVFRPEQLPEPRAWVDRWQEMARRAGLPGLYLVAEVSDLLGRGPAWMPTEGIGFDAGVVVRMPVDASGARTLKMRVGRRFLGWPERYPYRSEPVPFPPSLVSAARAADTELLPCVYPGWDNTPRSGAGGLVLDGASPERFRPHVRAAVDLLADRDPEHRLLFVKSWNEWAEGNRLEPDAAEGRGYLDVVADEVVGR